MGHSNNAQKYIASNIELHKNTKSLNPKQWLHDVTQDYGKVKEDNVLPWLQ